MLTLELVAKVTKGNPEKFGLARLSNRSPLPYHKGVRKRTVLTCLRRLVGEALKIACLEGVPIVIQLSELAKGPIIIRLRGLASEKLNSS